MNLPARLRFGDGTYGWGRVTNISQDGLFVESGARPRQGVGCIDVRLTFQGPSGPCPVIIPAFVMHQTNNGYGLMFRELGQPTREAISWLLRSKTPQLDRLEPGKVAAAGGSPNGGR